jgi:hypothetical protein
VNTKSDIGSPSLDHLFSVLITKASTVLELHGKWTHPRRYSLLDVSRPSGRKPFSIPIDKITVCTSPAQPFCADVSTLATPAISVSIRTGSTLSRNLCGTTSSGSLFVHRATGSAEQNDCHAQCLWAQLPLIWRNLRTRYDDWFTRMLANTCFREQCS